MGSGSGSFVGRIDEGNVLDGEHVAPGSVETNRGLRQRFDLFHFIRGALAAGLLHLAFGVFFLFDYVIDDHSGRQFLDSPGRIDPVAQRLADGVGAAFAALAFGLGGRKNRIGWIGGRRGGLRGSRPDSAARRREAWQALPRWPAIRAREPRECCWEFPECRRAAIRQNFLPGLASLRARRWLDRRFPAWCRPSFDRRRR